MKKSVFILFLFSITFLSAHYNKGITDEICDRTKIDIGNHSGGIDLFEEVIGSAYETVLEKESWGVVDNTNDSLSPKMGFTKDLGLPKAKFNLMESTVMAQELSNPYIGEHTDTVLCVLNLSIKDMGGKLTRVLELFDIVRKEKDEKGVEKEIDETGSWKGGVYSNNVFLNKKAPQEFPITMMDTVKGNYKLFEFKYTLGSESRRLKLKLYKVPKAGKDKNISVCSTDPIFNLFDTLDKYHSIGGKWTDPDKKVLKPNELMLDPSNLKAGTYIYEALKNPGNAPCPEDTAKITINVKNSYAGEDTDLELCEDSFSGSIDLSYLWGRLNKNDEKDIISSKGVWTDSNGKTITNSFKIDVKDKEFEEYKLKYTVTTNSNAANNVVNCENSAILTLKVYGKLNPGISTSVELCPSDSEFNIFDKLVDKNGNSPSKLGVWTYTDSNGKKKVFKTHNLMIDPKTFKGGVYLYKTNDVKDKKGNVLCTGGVSKVTTSFIPSYAGLNTSLELCEASLKKTSDKKNTVDLFELMKRNKLITKQITKGGTWLNTDTGKNEKNVFVFSELKGLVKTFKFKYTSPLVAGAKRSCEDTATLTFKVSKRLSSGSGKTLIFCRTDTLVVDLFKELGKGTSDKGNWSWTYLNKKFKSKTNEFKVKLDTCKIKTFVYKTPDVKDSSGNTLCSGQETTIKLEFQSPHDAGKDNSKIVCINGGVIDLFSLLKNSKSLKGKFYNAKGNIIDLPEKYSPKNLKRDRDTIFTYKISGGKCGDSEAKITLRPKSPLKPIAADQSFCLSKKTPVVDDLIVEESSDYEWYESIKSSKKLPSDTKLKDGVSYFVENIDANGCRSLRTKIKVTLIPIGGKNCAPCIKDGVTANGDGFNDDLDLCNLPEIYPNFTLEIYNRLGVLVFEGNNKTELFSGKSNVSNLMFGDELASGVYYYILNPNDNKTKLFKGDFYLGR